MILCFQGQIVYIQGQLFFNNSSYCFCRSSWDDDFLEPGRTVERLDKQVEVFQWTANSMAPHPGREFVELRLVLL